MPTAKSQLSKLQLAMMKIARKPDIKLSEDFLLKQPATTDPIEIAKRKKASLADELADLAKDFK